MPILVKNSPTKFHPCPIWNDGAFGFFLQMSLEQEEEQQDK